MGTKIVCNISRLHTTTSTQLHILGGHSSPTIPYFCLSISKDCFHSSIVNSSLIDGVGQDVVFADIMFAVVETSEREREREKKHQTRLKTRPELRKQLMQRL